MKIFGYWHSTTLPPFILNSIETTKKNNPYIDYDIYDYTQAIQFIKDNFDGEVLEAFNSFVPEAYKSDLLRLCLLYKFGGLYMDLKLILNPIDTSFFDSEYHFAKGTKRRCLKWKPIESSLLYFKKPGLPGLKKVIDRIVLNSKLKYKTCHDLYVTGPLLIGEYFQDYQPTLKFKAPKIPNIIHNYSYNGYNLVSNDLNPYYNKSHQSYWKLWKSKKSIYTISN